MSREKRTEETKRSEGNQSPSTPKMSARRDDVSANDGKVPKQPNIDMCLTGFTEQQGFRKRVSGVRGRPTKCTPTFERSEHSNDPRLDRRNHQS